MTKRRVVVTGMGMLTPIGNDVASAWGNALEGVSGAALTYRKGRAHRNASRIILNLHAYHAEHGTWPKTLLDALRTEPPAVRIDPFSGADFGYRLRDGEPVVYSVGINGRDDGGRPPASGPAWASTGDRVFWPPAGS